MSISSTREPSSSPDITAIERTADRREDARRADTTAGDASLWTELAAATTFESFGSAWLTLTCRSFEPLRRAAFLVATPNNGPFKPIARWSRRPEPGEVDAFVASLDAVLMAALSRRQPALEGIGSSESDGPVLIGYPVVVADALRCIVLAETGPLDQMGARRLVRHFQWSSGWVEAFLNRNADDVAAGLAERAHALIHAVEAVAAERRLESAARVLAGLLENRLRCAQVAVGRSVRKRTRLLAVSQTAVFQNRSNRAKLFANAADEAIDQGTALAAPGAEHSPFVVAAQEALRHDSAGAHVLTVPLVAEEEPFGALILLRHDEAFSQAELDLVDAIGSAAAPILVEKARNDRSLLALALARAGDWLGKLFGARHLGLKLATLALIAAAAFLAVATEDYEVRAHAEVQGEVRRSLAAPFDGYVRAAHARAGDTVLQGALLAELQDNDLVIDRLRHLSQKRQYQSELDKALAKRDLAGTNIAQAQVAQADADIELADQMLARAQLKAPFDAVVVAGDLSQAIGRPVSRGDSLFELTPLDRYRVTLVVPESDVPLVENGMSGEILLSALPDRPLPFTIKSLTPVARASEGVNGFEAIGTLGQRDDRVRPGMEGVAKINVGRRSVAWVWGHPLLYWMRLKIWSFVP
jgi:multidrug resistance efflux pump